MKHEMLSPEKLIRKLKNGEHVPNPIVGWTQIDGDENGMPRYLYHPLLLRAISKNLNGDLIQDFCTDEVYLKPSQ